MIALLDANTSHDTGAASCGCYGSGLYESCFLAGAFILITSTDMTPSYGMLRYSSMKRIDVDPKFCTGCGICIEFCPMKVLERSSELGEGGQCLAIPRFLEKCTLCRLCEFYCPSYAIAVEGERK